MVNIIQIKEIVDFYSSFKYESKYLINNKLKYYKAFFQYKNKGLEYLLKHTCDLTIDFLENDVFFTVIIEDFKIIIKDDSFSIINIDKDFSINIKNKNGIYTYTYNFYFQESSKCLILVIHEEKIIEFIIQRKFFTLNPLNGSQEPNNKHRILNLIQFNNNYEYDQEKIQVVNESLELNSKNLKIEGLDFLSLSLDIDEITYKEFYDIKLY